MLPSHLGMNIPDLRAKADSGFCVAQAILGICCLDGIDTKTDYEEAFRWLSAAAAQGASRATLHLARMHAEGLGIPQNVLEAIRLYKAAAAAGEFLAHIQLGRIYSRGLGVTPDPAAARDWYVLAVALENGVAEGEELQEARAYLAKLP